MLPLAEHVRRLFGLRIFRGGLRDYATRESADACRAAPTAPLIDPARAGRAVRDPFLHRLSPLGGCKRPAAEPLSGLHDRELPARAAPYLQAAGSNDL